jgi:hypothetical protein
VLVAPVAVGAFALFASVPVPVLGLELSLALLACGPSLCELPEPAGGVLGRDAALSCDENPFAALGTSRAAFPDAGLRAVPLLT